MVAESTRHTAGPRILVVEDDAAVRSVWATALERQGAGRVTTCADEVEALRRLRRETYRLCLLDLKMPRKDGLAVLAEARTLGLHTRFVVVSGLATREEVAQAVRLGASDAWDKPLDLRTLESRVLGLLEGAEGSVPSTTGAEPAEMRVFAGGSAAVRRLLAEARQAASSRATVLLLGESGTGKGVLARCIHAWSGRRGPFVHVSCAGVSEELLESGLLGHERGAYTGAQEARRGHFEAAAGGTLFLDEMGELPPRVQAAILLAVEEGWVRRLGGEAPLPVDVRVVSATNRNLAEAAGEGRFREDLFHRLAQVELHFPPLRERMEDLPALVEALRGPVARVAEREVKGPTPAAVAALCAYDWPGNVRQLENVLIRAVLRTGHGLIDVPHIIEVAALTGARGPDGRQSTSLAARYAELPEAERQLIEEALAATGGRVQGERGAARMLGVPATRLRSRMKVLGIEKAKAAP